jgi:cell division transport system permease protein
MANTIATRRTRPNYFYALISVALVLFVLGFFGAILLHAQQFVRLYKERVNLIVELVESASTSDMIALESFLENGRETILHTKNDPILQIDHTTLSVKAKRKLKQS